MKELKFRTLRADEIEVRPACVKDGYATLLLYIDSRAVVDLLNETIGAMNWTMDFYEANGKLVGKMGIWDEDKNMFIYKCDTGSESNIEAEKGLFSDCYKRCLSRFGVQELYTSPKIRIKTNDEYMSYYVDEIEYNEYREITKLIIKNRFNDIVFDWKYGKTVKQNTENKTDRLTELQEFCADKKTEEGINMKALVKFYNFYNGQDKNNPNMKIAETRKYWNVDKMWTDWLSREIV